jgi:ABC-2 type transport system ATP-binding protein
MTAPAIDFVHVNKRYGATDALRDVSFRVETGECFGLAGVNGAGKTTLLKCLLDFCELGSGAIDIFGTPHNEARSRGPVAYLPERFNPPFYLTGIDFLKYTAKLHGVSYDPDAVARTLESLDLAFTVLSKPARVLSKGMTQKLGLAACLLSGKRLYIFDEPMSGLDPRARALTKEHVRRLQSEGCTLFLTSHALSDIAQLCNRMAVLHDGQLRFAGTPDTLCRSYGETDVEQAFLRCIG